MFASLLLDIPATNRDVLPARRFFPGSPSAIHPAVRTHPETDSPMLFVNPSFTRKFVGVSAEESAALLDACLATVGRPEYTCSFRWRPGSLALWDNRACLHYVPPDFWPHDRYHERVTVVDSDEARKVPRPFFPLQQAGAAGAERQGGMAGGGMGRSVEEEVRRNEAEIARLQQLNDSLRAGAKL